MPIYNSSLVIYSFADFGKTDDSFFLDPVGTTYTLGASTTPDYLQMTDDDSLLETTAWPLDTGQVLTSDLFIDGVQVGSIGDQVTAKHNTLNVYYQNPPLNYHFLRLVTIMVNGAPVGLAHAIGFQSHDPIPPGSVLTNNSTVGYRNTYDRMVQCFAAGTEIECQHGTRTVETLQAGDLVLTKAYGLKPIRWVSRQTVSGHGPMAPICFSAGVLGNSEDLMVSPMHRMLITGPKAEVLFGAPAFLAHAKDLCNDHDIRPKPCHEITYFHILFDEHELINAYGCWSESFAATKEALNTMEADVKAELLTIFPHLAAPWQDALPTLSAAEVRVLRV